MNTAIRACAELRGARRRMVERLASGGVRDARVLTIGGGATEVMLEEVAKRS